MRIIYYADLTDGTIGAQFRVNELGAPIASSTSFTGTTEAGAISASGSDFCANWTLATGQAASGLGDSTTSTWTLNQDDDCNVSHHLYCLQQ